MAKIKLIHVSKEPWDANQYQLRLILAGEILQSVMYIEYVVTVA